MENRKPNYWEDVEPEEVDTGKNVFRFYPEAERLQVSMPDFKKADGVWRHGKTIGIDVRALREEMAADPTIADFFKAVLKL
jgi:hypothetical protein